MRQPALHILVAESDALLADAIRSALQPLGAEAVEVVGTLAQYRLSVAARAPTLALVSQRLPDGAATAVLPGSRAAATFPVVVLVGTGDEQGAGEAMAAGALDYVVAEPAFIADLPHVVERATREWDLLQESRRSDAALRDSSERLSRTIESSQAGYYLIDRQGLFQYVNDAWLAMHKYSSRDEVIGQHFRITQVGADLARAAAVVEQALRGEALPVSESPRLCKDGSIGYHTYSVSPVVAGGEVVGLDGFLIDTSERRRAVEALRTSEALLRSLFDSMTELVAVHEVVYGESGTAVDYRIIDCNPAFSRHTGIQEAQARGALASELYGTTPAPYLDVYARVADNGMPCRFEAYFAPMGKYFLVSAFALDGGRFATVSSDFSERYAAEAALRQSEARYRAIVRDQVDLICRYTPDGTITFANDAFCRYFGLDAQRVLGTHWQPDVPPEDLPAAFVGESYFSPARPNRVAEHRVILHDGQVRWQQWSDHALFGDSGRLAETQSVGRDITEFRRVQEALQRRALRLESLLRTAQQLTGSLERDQVLSMIAEQAHTLLRAEGCTLYLLDADGRHLMPVVALHPLYAAQLMAAPAEVDASLTGRAVREGRALVFNNPSAQGQGQHLPGMSDREEERMIVAPFIAEGKVLGALRVDRSGDPFDEEDLTLTQTFASYAAAVLRNAQTHERLQQEMRERQRAEAQLLQAQKMESVGRLAGGVAHDFNNILTAITGYAEFLLSEVAASPEARADVEELLRNADRASALTKQLLAFSRKQVMAMRPVDVNELMRGTGRLLRRLIGEDIELVLVVAARDCQVYADTAQLEQVLVNLAVNAKDAMPDGGRLTIAATMSLWPAETDGTAAPPGDCVRIEVADTGAGMTPETMSHLFEPFYTTKEVGKGTGLGLATVYGIVKQHGGEIKVDSRTGEGTTFAIYLPLLAEQRRPAEREQVPEPAPGVGEKVLLVEDDPTVRAVTRRTLDGLGYRVVEASNGEEALHLASQMEEPPDLVITDLVMPRLSGIELARRLRQALPRLPVLYVSGYTTENEALAQSTGAGDHYLAKPFTSRALAARVREALQPH